MKEHKSLASKCELAREKMYLIQGQNQRYGAIRDTIGRVVSHVSWTCVWTRLSLLVLTHNQWMGGFTRPRGYRSGVKQTRLACTFVTPLIILQKIKSGWRHIKAVKRKKMVNKVLIFLWYRVLYRLYWFSKGIWTSRLGKCVGTWYVNKHWWALSQQKQDVFYLLLNKLNIDLLLQSYLYIHTNVINVDICFKWVFLRIPDLTTQGLRSLSGFIQVGC